MLIFPQDKFFPKILLIKIKTESEGEKERQKYRKKTQNFCHKMKNCQTTIRERKCWKNEN